ncbi:MULTISPECIES: DUF2976 domain-containing protein [Aeromonas]|jgi:integrating conjugative element membrane protein (TIGR03745 family)|uniref:DUF2976 domain-containing protein n=3 Tax=Aeromonas TaxID=642 RepID=A0A5F0KBH0_9GAMM|nr:MULTISPECIES: DUF2976 domain-containing protein [Aeromonas]ELB2793634.1 DUF2976 domain-containing protein [Aeromonas hydrophila]MBF4801830.1 DUF2976 domain-containing protein [Aeromonas hydrophila]MBS2783033.1 DUF2976 domain-containing protein [Aeromonas salmonicida]MCE9970040.1 DUF2976 domain-containing protein [Aeromonas salmonicida]MDH1507849.1 DUF2976 domain-containing protein [Aeromonas caviae]
MPMKKVSNRLRGVCFMAALMAGEVHAVGLPTINAPGGSASNDPFALIVNLFKWGLTVIAFLLVALMFITVVKNGWQKYHQLGEENSKVTWRDLASNLVAGALLICLGVAMANYAVGVFGASAIS